MSSLIGAIKSLLGKSRWKDDGLEVQTRFELAIVQCEKAAARKKHEAYEKREEIVKSFPGNSLIMDIKVKGLIRLKKLEIGYTVLAGMLKVVLKRIRMMANEKIVPADLERYIGSIIFACKYVELRSGLEEIKKDFIEKYGKKFVEKYSDCELVDNNISNNFVCMNPSPDEIYNELLAIFGDATLVGNPDACILHLYLPFSPTDREHELRIVHCFSKTTQIIEVIEVVKQRVPILKAYDLCMVKLPNLPQQTPAHVQAWLEQRRREAATECLYEGLTLEAAGLHAGAGKCACVYVGLGLKERQRLVYCTVEEQKKESEIVLSLGLQVGLPVGAEEEVRQEPEVAPALCLMGGY